MNNLFHIVSVLDRKTSLNWHSYINFFQEKDHTADRERKGRPCGKNHSIQVYD